MERFSYKDECVMHRLCMRVVLSGLKEELAWDTDKRLWVIRNIMLFKTVILLRKKPF